MVFDDLSEWAGAEDNLIEGEGGITRMGKDGCHSTVLPFHSCAPSLHRSSPFLIASFLIVLTHVTISYHPWHLAIAIFRRVDHPPCGASRRCKARLLVPHDGGARTHLSGR